VKRRMSDDIRYRLRGLADQLVKPIRLAEALEAAYKKAAPVVRKVVEAKYPPKDMRILAKYEAAGPDKCVKVQLANGTVEKFDFTDDAPFVVSSYCSNRMYLAGDASGAIEDWAAARDKFNEERKRRLADYNSLILTAKYVEEITGVWPEAEKLLPKRQELVALNDDVLARIKRDIAERSRATAAAD
jgi:hypothetical protein